MHSLGLAYLSTRISILQVDKYASPRECMKNLHWLLISKRIEHKILTIVYTCTRGLAPKYLQDLIKQCIPSRPRLCSSGSSTKLVVPRVTRQTFAAIGFSVCGPSLWNSLPADLTHAISEENMKKFGDLYTTFEIISHPELN